MSPTKRNRLGGTAARKDKTLSKARESLLSGTPVSSADALIRRRPSRGFAVVLVRQVSSPERFLNPSPLRLRYLCKVLCREDLTELRNPIQLFWDFFAGKESHDASDPCSHYHLYFKRRENIKLIELGRKFGSSNPASSQSVVASSGKTPNQIAPNVTSSARHQCVRLKMNKRPLQSALENHDGAEVQFVSAVYCPFKLS